MLDEHHARDRARNLLTLHRLDEARSVLSDLLSSDPTNGETLRLLADVELAADDPEAAHAAARDAVAHDPVARSFHTLARTERQLGDFAAAVSSCERGLAVDPDDPGLHVTLALAWAGPWLNDTTTQASNERVRAHTAASAAAQRALELDPERPNAHYAAAVSHLVTGDAFGASKALEPGLALAPEWPEGHLLMGAIRARQGMAKLSSRHLAIAGRLNPRDDTSIGVLRRMSGRRRFARSTPPWWLAPEARDVLEADRRLGGPR